MCSFVYRSVLRVVELVANINNIVVSKIIITSENIFVWFICSVYHLFTLKMRSYLFMTCMMVYFIRT